MLLVSDRSYQEFINIFFPGARGFRVPSQGRVLDVVYSSLFFPLVLFSSEAQTWDHKIDSQKDTRVLNIAFEKC